MEDGKIKVAGEGDMPPPPSNEYKIAGDNDMPPPPTDELRASPKSNAPSNTGGESGAFVRPITPSTPTSASVGSKSASWTKTANPLDSKFQNFKKTLPSNLKNTDESTYNLRGYWEGLGKPDKFDYSQKKEADGTYHGSSRNPKTGEILKKRNHPTFNQALEEDAKIGYMPYISPDGTVYTFSKEDKIPSGFKPYKPTAKPVDAVQTNKIVEPKKVGEYKPLVQENIQKIEGMTMGVKFPEYSKPSTKQTFDFKQASQEAVSEEQKAEKEQTLKRKEQRRIDNLPSEIESLRKERADLLLDRSPEAKRKLAANQAVTEKMQSDLDNISKSKYESLQNLNQKAIKNVELEINEYLENNPKLRDEIKVKGLTDSETYALVQQSVAKKITPLEADLQTFQQEGTVENARKKAEISGNLQSKQKKIEGLAEQLKSYQDEYLKKAGFSDLNNQLNSSMQTLKKYEPSLNKAKAEVIGYEKELTQIKSKLDAYQSKIEGNSFNGTQQELNDLKALEKDYNETINDLNNVYENESLNGYEEAVNNYNSLAAKRSSIVKGLQNNEYNTIKTQYDAQIAEYDLALNDYKKFEEPEIKDRINKYFSTVQKIGEYDQKVKTTRGELASIDELEKAKKVFSNAGGGTDVLDIGGRAVNSILDAAKKLVASPFRIAGSISDVYGSGGDVYHYSDFVADLIEGKGSEPLFLTKEKNVFYDSVTDKINWGVVPVLASMADQAGVLLVLALTGKYATPTVASAMTTAGTDLTAAAEIAESAKIATTIAPAFMIGYGDNYKEALDKGFSAGGAMAYSGALSFLEGLTETILPDQDLLFGKGAKEMMLNRFIKDYAKGKNYAIKNLVNDFAYNAFGEATEEGIAALGKTIATSIGHLVDKNIEIEIPTMNQNITTSITAGLTGGGMGIVGSVSENSQMYKMGVMQLANDFETGKALLSKLNEKGKIDDKRYNKLTSDVQKFQSVRGQIPEGLSGFKTMAIFEKMIAIKELSAQMDKDKTNPFNKINSKKISAIQDEIEKIVDDKNFDARAEYELNLEAEELGKPQEQKPLEEKPQEQKPVELKKNTSPTNEKYGTVNRNDGKGVVNLTKEEYDNELNKATPEAIAGETIKTKTNEKANEDGEQKRGKDGEENVTESLQSKGEIGGQQVNLEEKQVLETAGVVEAAPIVEEGFDYNRLFDANDEELNKAVSDSKEADKALIEAERESDYQKTTFDKRWAATYKEAKNKLVKQYFDAKKELETWSNKSYKSAGSSSVFVGDEMEGQNVKIDYINNKRKQNRITNAKSDMEMATSDLRAIGLTDIEIDEITKAESDVNIQQPMGESKVDVEAVGETPKEVQTPKTKIDENKQERPMLEEPRDGRTQDEGGKESTELRTEEKEVEPTQAETTEEATPKDKVWSKTKAYNNLGKVERKSAYGSKLRAEIMSEAEALGYTVKPTKQGKYILVDERGKEIINVGTPRSKDAIQEEKRKKERRSRARRELPISVKHSVAQDIANGVQFDREELKKVTGLRDNEIPFWMTRTDGKGETLEFYNQKYQEKGGAYVEDDMDFQSQVGDAIGDFAHKQGRTSALEYIESIQEKLENGGLTDAEMKEQAAEYQAELDEANFDYFAEYLSNLSDAEAQQLADQLREAEAQENQLIINEILNENGSENKGEAEQGKQKTDTKTPDTKGKSETITALEEELSNIEKEIAKKQAAMQKLTKDEQADMFAGAKIQMFDNAEILKNLTNEVKDLRQKANEVKAKIEIQLEKEANPVVEQPKNQLDIEKEAKKAAAKEKLTDPKNASDLAKTYRNKFKFSPKQSVWAARLFDAKAAFMSKVLGISKEDYYSQYWFGVNEGEGGLSQSERNKNALSSVEETAKELKGANIGNVLGGIKIFRGQQKGMTGRWFTPSKKFAEIFSNSVKGKAKLDAEVIEQTVLGNVLDFPYNVTEYARISDKLADMFGVTQQEIRDALSKTNESLGKGEAIRIHALLEDKNFGDLLASKGIDYVKAKENLTKTESVDTFLKISNKPQEQLIAEAYHKAKIDGSNPALVESLESVIAEKIANQEGGLSQVEAWHGSPYSFDKFTTEKIGTGEGAQSFGWGLYFTDLEGIARDYAEKLAKAQYDAKSFGQENTGIANRAILNIESTGSVDNAINFLKDLIEKNKNGDTSKTKEILDFIEKNKDKFTISKNIYKVSLHKGKTPDQYTWLEWDKKLTEQQSAKIIDALKKEGLDAKKTSLLYDAGFGDKEEIRSENGKGVYTKLSELLGGDKQASLFLLKNGIDGVKYPAESIAMGRTSDTARGFNYVVFDESAVTIEEAKLFQDRKGSWTKDAARMKRIINMYEKADSTTAVHEMLGHDYLDRIIEASATNKEFEADLRTIAEEYIKDTKSKEKVEDVIKALKEFDVEKNPSIKGRKIHEWFATQAEQYFATEKDVKRETPQQSKMAKIFEAFRAHLAELYDIMNKTLIAPSEPMKQVFRKVFGEENFNKAEEIRAENVEAINNLNAAALEGNKKAGGLKSLADKLKEKGLGQSEFAQDIWDAASELIANGKAKRYNVTDALKEMFPAIEGDIESMRKVLQEIGTTGKLRQGAENILANPTISDEVKEKVAKMSEYTPETLKKVGLSTNEVIDYYIGEYGEVAGLEKIKSLLDKGEFDGYTEKVAIQQSLIGMYNKLAKFGATEQIRKEALNNAVDVAEQYINQGTSFGRAINAYKLLGSLTTEGRLVWAKRQTNKYVKPAHEALKENIRDLKAELKDAYKQVDYFFEQTLGREETEGQYKEAIAQYQAEIDALKARKPREPKPSKTAYKGVKATREFKESDLANFAKDILAGGLFQDMETMTAPQKLAYGIMEKKPINISEFAKSFGRYLGKKIDPKELESLYVQTRDLLITKDLAFADGLSTNEQLRADLDGLEVANKAKIEELERKKAEAEAKIAAKDKKGEKKEHSEELADFVIKDAKKAMNGSIAKQKTYLDEILKALKEKVGDVVKKGEKNKVHTAKVSEVEAIKFALDAINNGGADANMWNDAVEQVKAKIKADNDLSQQDKDDLNLYLNDYTSFLYDNLLSENKIFKVIREKLIQSGYGNGALVNWKQIIEGADGDVNNMREIIQKLVKNQLKDYDNVQVEKVLDAIVYKYDQEINKQRKKIADKYIEKELGDKKSTKKKTAAVQGKIGKLLIENRLGILKDGNEDMLNELAAAKGLQMMSAADWKTARQLAENIENSADGNLKNQAIEEMTAFIASKQPLSWMDTASAIRFAGLLGRPITALTNLLGNISQGGVAAVGMAARFNFSFIPQSIKGINKGNFNDIFFSGGINQSSKTSVEVNNTGMPYFRALEYGKKSKYISSGKYVSRVLDATDATFQQMFTDAYDPFYLAKYFKIENPTATKSEIDAMVKKALSVSYDKGEFDAMFKKQNPNATQAEIDILVNEALKKTQFDEFYAQALQDVIKSGKKPTPANVKRRTYEILRESKVPPIVRELANMEADEGTFKSELKDNLGIATLTGMLVQKSLGVPKYAIEQMVNGIIFLSTKKGSYNEETAKLIANKIGEAYTKIEYPFVRGVANVYEKGIELELIYGLSKSIIKAIGATRMPETTVEERMHKVRVQEKAKSLAANAIAINILMYGLGAAIASMGDDDESEEEKKERLSIKGMKVGKDDLGGNTTAKERSEAENTLTVFGHKIPLMRLAGLGIAMGIDANIYEALTKEDDPKKVYNSLASKRMDKIAEAGNKVVLSLMQNPSLMGKSERQSLMYALYTGGTEKFFNVLENNVISYAGSYMLWSGFVNQSLQGARYLSGDKSYQEAKTLSEKVQKQMGLAGLTYDNKRPNYMGRPLEATEVNREGIQGFIAMFSRDNKPKIEKWVESVGYKESLVGRKSKQLATIESESFVSPTNEQYDDFTDNTRKLIGKGIEFAYDKRNEVVVPLDADGGLEVNKKTGKAYTKDEYTNKLLNDMLNAIEGYKRTELVNRLDANKYDRDEYLSKLEDYYYKLEDVMYQFYREGSIDTDADKKRFSDKVNSILPPPPEE